VTHIWNGAQMFLQWMKRLITFSYMTMCYLNGKILPLDEARVSVLDRGFMFGDGAYEVVRVYSGNLFLFQEHLNRLEKSLEGLDIKTVDIREVERVGKSLVAECNSKEATLYIQITRGSPTKRSHAYEENYEAKEKPTIFVYAMKFNDSNLSLRKNGCMIRSFPEVRWGRCDIKSINLLGNVFAAQFAKRNAVYETVFLGQDGLVTEGSHTNVFAVLNGRIRTMPKSPRILPGITRDKVLEIAEKKKLVVEEWGVTLDELLGASEVFLTGTSTEVMPVIQCDGKKIGRGEPGPITRELQSAYNKLFSL
jgi:D-alanine transaminase